MIPEIAVIKTANFDYKYNKKICGLFPLERNIIILSKIGVKKIILDLCEEEIDFYEKKLKKRLKKLRTTEIHAGNDSEISIPYIYIPSNLFTQIQYFQKFDIYFNRDSNKISPELNEKQFLILNDVDFKNAENLVTQYIIENTGGFIAQKINKRISIPISLVVSKTRIHPNYLTVLNMFVGLLSGIFLLFDTYYYIALGGLFFQLASVMDGVDGEVAKFTFTVSRIGGWLDTISDNLTLILFISAASYLYYIKTGGLLSLVFIVMTFIGIAVMISVMVRYLKRHSESGSLVAYDREFLQKLPQNDFLIIITQKMKHFTKKEFFSIAFFAVCLTGNVHFIIPIIAIILTIASIVLISIDIKYLKTFKV